MIGSPADNVSVAISPDRRIDNSIPGDIAAGFPKALAWPKVRLADIKGLLT